MADIMHLVHFDAPPAAVYAALTTAEGVRSWWTGDADLDEEVGGTGEFRFYGGDKVTRVRIDELSPSRRVAWTVINSFRPEWVGTSITFDLRFEAEGTDLLFAQRGYPQADEVYALCTTGWGIYFSRLGEQLKKQLELGDKGDSRWVSSHLYSGAATAPDRNSCSVR